MKSKVWIAGLIALIPSLLSPVFAVQDITVNYVFEGNLRVDFSDIPGGPLRIGDFIDNRKVDNPNLIIDSEGGYIADKPLAQIVRNALIQGLLKSNAALVETGENLRVEGSIISSEAQLVNKNGIESIQLTIRTNIKLMGSGRTLWETNLFGRGTVPVAEGMNKALSNALDRTITGLLEDDYFRINML